MMIIQNTSPTSQAATPDVRAVGGTPVVAGPSVPAQNPAPQASVAELKSAVETINKAMQASNQNLEFSVDTSSHEVVVRMVDTSTGDLIRQYPSEQAIAISREIDQFQQGLLLKQKA